MAEDTLVEPLHDPGGSPLLPDLERTLVGSAVDMEGDRIVVGFAVEVEAGLGTEVGLVVAEVGSDIKVVDLVVGEEVGTVVVVVAEDRMATVPHRMHPPAPGAEVDTEVDLPTVVVEGG